MRKTKAYKKRLEGNIWKHGLHLITNKRAYMSFLGVYLLTLPGATPQTIGLMTLVGNIIGFLFEIPSGYLADKMGHKRAMVLSRVALLLSTLCYFIGSYIPMFLLAAALLNTAQALQSGTSAALMHETLADLGRDSEYSKVMGRVKSVGFAVPVLFIVGLPLLVSYGYQMPFLVMLLIDAVGLAAVASYEEPRKTSVQIKEISNTRFMHVVREGYSYGYFKYALFTGVMMGAVTSFAIYRDAYQAFLGVPVIYYGLFWGISRVVISVLLPLNGFINRTITFNTFLALKLAALVGMLAGLSYSASPYVVVFLFILFSAFNWSFGAAQTQYYFDLIGKSKFKATLISLNTLINSLVLAVVSYGIGVLAYTYSYSQSFFYISIVVLGLLFVQYAYIVRSSIIATSRSIHL